MNLEEVESVNLERSVFKFENGSSGRTKKRYKFTDRLSVYVCVRACVLFGAESIVFSFNAETKSRRPKPT